MGLCCRHNKGLGHPKGELKLGGLFLIAQLGAGSWAFKSHVNLSLVAGCPKKGAVMSGRAALFN